MSSTAGNDVIEAAPDMEDGAEPVEPIVKERVSKVQIATRVVLGIAAAGTIGFLIASLVAVISTSHSTNPLH